MVDVAQYEITVENERYTIELGDTPVTTLTSRARKLAIPSGHDTITWSFTTALTGAATDYVPVVSLQNTADSFPQDLIARISSFSINAITIKLNAPTDSANYAANVVIIGALNP